MKNLLITIIVIFFLSSCKEGARYQKWYNDTKIVKEELEGKPSINILSADDFSLLKRYFSQIKEFSVELSLNTTLKDGINKYLLPSNIEKFCAELLVTDSFYVEIDGLCRKGRYLCAQEVEGYKRFLKGVFDKLNSDTKDAWTKSENCPAIEED